MITVLWGAPALAMAEAMPFRSEARFPLTVAPSGRFLVDAVGTPFLLCGDAAWSLVAELTREDAEIYLEDRRARGFNAVLASVVEHHFSTHPPTNAYGQQPFLMPGDFSTPNDAYFRHLDWLVRRAGEKGLLVMLAPAYLGIGGGEQGWYAEMAANGPERLRQYGHYLGSRYRDAANILWVHGGDYDPPDRALVAAVAEGIREVAPNGLHTIHGAPETVVDEYWREAAPWLQLNSLYTYRPVAAKASAAYDRAQTIPFILLESAYENEHGTTARDLRAQAYQALLSGAAGQVFGNNPVWHFHGSGVEAAALTWRQALDSSGAHGMTHLRSLFDRLPWWRLQPDRKGALVIRGAGVGQDRVAAALSPDGALAVLYVPMQRPVTLDLSQLAGPRVMSTWFDPSGGRFAPVAGAPYRTERPMRFQPSGSTSDGHGDWVLVLVSQP